MNEVNDGAAAVRNLDTTVSEMGPPAPVVRANNDTTNDDNDDEDDYNVRRREELLYEYRKQFLFKVEVCKEYLQDKDPVLYRQVLQIEDDSMVYYRNHATDYWNYVRILKHNMFVAIPDVYWSVIEEHVCQLEQQQQQLEHEILQQQQQILQQLLQEEEMNE